MAVAWSSFTKKKHFLDTSLDEECDLIDTNILMAATTLVHMHKEKKPQRFKGSKIPRKANSKHNWEIDHVRL
jgi:hypothetical protein